MNVVFSLKKVFCSLTLLFSHPGDEDMRQLRESAKMVTAVTKLSAAHLRYSCSCERRGMGASPECPPASEFPYSLTASSYVSMPVSL
jgi:hypothetical protein